MGDGAGFGERKMVQSVSNIRLLLVLKVLQKRYGTLSHCQRLWVFCSTHGEGGGATRRRGEVQI